MAHLLEQACKRNARRIFVVLPYTSIIRQSVDIYRKALVLPGETPEDVVAELHSRADFEDIETRYLTALWRAPIVVTTAVAFFETLSSHNPAALRLLLGAGFRFAGPVLGTPTVIRTLYAPTGDRGAGPT